RRGTTTRWATRRAASICSSSWESGVEEKEPAGSAPAGAGREARADPGRLQRPDQERESHRRHAAAGVAADDHVSAREGGAGRAAVAPGPPQGRARSAVLAQAD